MQWYMDVLKKYAVFQGRARRTEYWMFTLVNSIIQVVLLSIGLALAISSDKGNNHEMLVAGLVVLGVWLLYHLATLLPLLGVSVRRLHDTGKSGWMVLLGFVPLGGIVLLIFMCLDSEMRTNEYGPVPKALATMPIAQAYGQGAGQM